MIVLFFACGREEARTERSLAEWGAAWCGFVDACCTVENSPSGNCTEDRLTTEACEAEWEIAYTSCVIRDRAAFDACVECYETASLEDIGTRSCTSHIAVQCGAACENTILCEE